MPTNDVLNVSRNDRSGRGVKTSVIAFLNISKMLGTRDDGQFDVISFSVKANFLHYQ